MCVFLGGLTVHREVGEGLHPALLVDGSAHVGPRIIVGYLGNRQDAAAAVPALGGEFAMQLGRSTNRAVMATLTSHNVQISVSGLFSGAVWRGRLSMVTLDHLMSGSGYPVATQGRTASEPTVTSLVSGRPAIWGRARHNTYT